MIITIYDEYWRWRWIDDDYNYDYNDTITASAAVLKSAYTHLLYAR